MYEFNVVLALFEHVSNCVGLLINTIITIIIAKDAIAVIIAKTNQIISRPIDWSILIHNSLSFFLINLFQQNENDI